MTAKTFIPGTGRDGPRPKAQRTPRGVKVSHWGASVNVAVAASAEAVAYGTAHLTSDTARQLAAVLLDAADASDALALALQGETMIDHPDLPELCRRVGELTGDTELPVTLLGDGRPAILGGGRSWTLDPRTRALMEWTPRDDEMGFDLRRLDEDGQVITDGAL